MHRAPVVPTLGTAASRAGRDDLTHTHVRTALTEFAREVRRHDPHRLLISGNAFPRPSAWHQLHEGNWKSDTSEQWTEMLAADNPSPITSLSGRLYSTNDLAALAPATALSRQLGKPLFIGEFGVPDPAASTTVVLPVRSICTSENSALSCCCSGVRLGSRKSGARFTYSRLGANQPDRGTSVIVAIISASATRFPST